jgi:3-hydroxy-D-aspartate aldolase
VTLPDVDTPALLLDADALGRNIARMRDLVAGSGLALRPHAKTHKTPRIALMQLAAGAAGICCSKLAEAEVMVGGGIMDILITTPVVGASKIARLMRLAHTAGIRVVVDDAVGIDALGDAAAAAKVSLDVLIEVDVGQARCGVPPGQTAADLAGRIGRHRALRFAGLQGYNGALQGVAAFEERAARVRASLDLLLETAGLVRKRGIEVATLTGGGTGSSAIDLELRGLTELQPGSYVVMDASYAKVRDRGADALPFERALGVLATVVSRPAPDRCVVDVGWKSVSVDSGPPLVAGHPDLMFEFAGDEHGKLRSTAGAVQLRPGDRIELIPAHCDTTINLYDAYTVMRDGRVEGLWPIEARGRTQ